MTKDDSKLKTQKERLEECIHIAKQLDEHGITRAEFPERKEIDDHMNDFVRTGDGWTGKVKFPALHRIAEVILATRKQTPSAINLRFAINPYLAAVKGRDT